jgi:TetR/AcrR family transcriptional regulator
MEESQIVDRGSTSSPVSADSATRVAPGGAGKGRVAFPADVPKDAANPKQWEIRAALRAMARSRETSSRRNPAEALVEAANAIVTESDDFTVKQVAERAGVALQTFYRHFGSKDELILAMLEENIGRGSERYEGEVARLQDPIEKLRFLVQAPMLRPMNEAQVRLQHWRGRERERLSQRYPREVHAVHEPYRSQIIAVLHLAKSAGLIESENPELDGMLIQEHVLVVQQVVLTHGTEFTPQEAAERVWDMCWRGLARREGEASKPRAVARAVADR